MRDGTKSNQVIAIVKKRRRKFDTRLLDQFVGEQNPGCFFQHINALLGANEPRESSVSSFPDKTGAEAAEEFASFFNNISSE